MPAVSSPRTECIAKLADELCFASKPTLVRHLERVDALAPNIDPEGLYPEDWIVFRVTGYRTEIPDPAMIPGQALLGDLSALAERLSEAAALTKEDVGPGAHTITTLTKRWSVSKKTIERYRRRGLIARRINGGKGIRTLAFMPEAVEWFERSNEQRLGRASRFSRSNTGEVRAIERWARRYRERLGWSRSRTAARIAQRTGRCHEGVRQILLRLDRDRCPPIFPEPGPPGSREQLFALRARNRIIPTSEIAKHLGRNATSVRRAINTARYEVLVDCGISAPDGYRDKESEKPMAAEPVRSGLTVPPVTDLNTLIGMMRIQTPVVVYEEKARANGYRALIARAHRILGSLNPTNLSGVQLDELETTLRWASKLKAAMISTELHLVLTTIENQIGGPVDSLRPDRAAELILEAIAVASSALDRYHPEHGGRLAAPIGLALTRFASRQPDAAVPIAQGKAARRIPPGYAIVDWTRTVAPWQRWLDPDPRLAGVLEQLDETDRVVLITRYGFGGTPPSTVDAIAEQFELPRVRAAQRIRQSYRAGLDAVRKEVYKK